MDPLAFWLNTCNTYAAFNGSGTAGLSVWYETFLTRITFTDHLLLIGDWNAVETESLDRQNSIRSANDNCAIALFDRMRQNGMLDVWRVRHPVTRAFSYRINGIGVSRIDRLYVSESMNKFGTNVKYGYSPTDHSPIAFSINRPDHVSWGRSFWKIYNSIILSDFGLSKSISDFWIIWQHKKDFVCVNTSVVGSGQNWS
jgi:hypothetical protein